jgi:hypothetical protein
MPSSNGDSRSNNKRLLFGAVPFVFFTGVVLLSGFVVVVTPSQRTLRLTASHIKQPKAARTNSAISPKKADDDNTMTDLGDGVYDISPQPALTTISQKEAEEGSIIKEAGDDNTMSDAGGGVSDFEPQQARTTISQKEADNDKIIQESDDDKTTTIVSTPAPIFAPTRAPVQTPTKPSSMHVDYHTNRFDYTSSWCPNANCTGSPICYPCQRRWLIVLATGRSVSTTLKEMIERLPGIRMTGENNNLVDRFVDTLQEMPVHMTRATSPAWSHNPIREESWSCAAQTIFTTVNPPKLAKTGELPESDEQTILGFKEIRIFPNDFTPTTGLTQMQIQKIAKDMVERLNHLFPCSRVVVNFRSDVQSQVASHVSRFHINNEAEALHQIQRDNDILHAFHQAMGRERSFLLDSTTWTKNISAFNQMLDWLGFSDSCHFTAALEYNTKDGYKATKTEAHLSQNCKYLHY